MNGGSCFAPTAAEGGGARCVCAEGFSGESCEVEPEKRRVSAASGDAFEWSFVPRFHASSFAELPTLRHVGREFDIVVWEEVFDSPSHVSICISELLFDSSAELTGSLKLGNVLVFVQLIHSPMRTKNQLYKNPNIA